VHTNDYDYAVPPETLTDADLARRETFLSTRYETVHPVVRVHPLTGERALFIGGFAQRVAGLSVGESRDVLRLLQYYVTQPGDHRRRLPLHRGGQLISGPGPKSHGPFGQRILCRTGRGSCRRPAQNR
jgi:alpha-ketoglutarate-dependent taurine dioxygenase